MIVVPVFASLGPILSMFLASGAPASPARDPNMTAQCSPPPSQHLQYLLTLDMQLISLLYHWLFTSLHIFAWGLEKHKALFAQIHFAKFTNYLWLVINFIWQKGFVFSELITSSHINKYWWVRLKSSDSETEKLKIHTAAQSVWLEFSHSYHIWL